MKNKFKRLLFFSVNSASTAWLAMQKADDTWIINSIDDDLCMSIFPHNFHNAACVCDNYNDPKLKEVLGSLHETEDFWNIYVENKQSKFYVTEFVVHELELNPMPKIETSKEIEKLLHSAINKKVSVEYVGNMLEKGFAILKSNNEKLQKELADAKWRLNEIASLTKGKVVRIDRETMFVQNQKVTK